MLTTDDLDKALVTLNQSALDLKARIAALPVGTTPTPIDFTERIAVIVQVTTLLNTLAK